MNWRLARERKVIGHDNQQTIVDFYSSEHADERYIILVIRSTRKINPLIEVELVPVTTDVLWFHVKVR